MHARPETIEDLQAELERARAKYPGGQYRLAALMEEVGELSKALMENSLAELHPAFVYSEAIQVAAMALRIAEEGDDGHVYQHRPLWHAMFAARRG